MLNIGTSSNHSRWSNVVRFIMPILIAFLGIVGCSTTPGRTSGETVQDSNSAGDDQLKQNPVKKSDGERLIGRVTGVHESSQFVVVRSSYGRVRLPVGSPLEARGTDGVRTALRLSPEQNPAFLCADYQEAPPRIGDLVFRLAPIDEASFDDLPEMTTSPPLFSDRD